MINSASFADDDASKAVAVSPSDSEDELWPFRNFDRRASGRLLCFSLIISFIVNAYHIFVFPLTVDGEVFAFLDQPEDFLANERWAGELLARLLVPNSTIPVVPDLLAITAAAAAYTLTVITWQPRIRFEHYVAAPLALAFPIFFEVMLFPSYSYQVFIGLLFAATGVHFMARATVRAYVIALGCLCLAVGVYQPIALYPVVAQAIAVALDIDRGGISAGLRRLVIGGVVIVTATLLSHLIGLAIIKVGAHSSDYIGSFFRIELLANAPRKVLWSTVRFGYTILSGTADVFLRRCAPFVAFLALAAAWGMVALVKAPIKSRALFSTVMIIGGVVGAIGVAVINGGVLPMRTLLGLPLALAGIVFAAARNRKLSSFWAVAARWSFGVASAWCFLAFATIGSRIYYSANVTWLNDRALGQDVIARIDSLPELDSSKPIPIELSGHFEWPKSQMVPSVGSNPAGASFFGWDDGNTGRVLSFFKTLGRFNFEEASPEQHAKIAARVAAMPSWPRPGAVAIVDGVAVIKFGPYSEAQR